MDDVAALAGVARATRYRHFPTREALLEALMRDFVSQLGRALDAVEEPCRRLPLAIVELAAGGIRDNPGLLEVAAFKDVPPQLRDELRGATRRADRRAAAARAGGRPRPRRPAPDRLLRASSRSTSSVAELAGQADARRARSSAA